MERGGIRNGIRRRRRRARGADRSMWVKNVETCLHVVAIKYERFECVQNRIKIRENIIYLHVFRSEEKEELPLCFFERMRCEAESPALYLC